MAAVIITVVVVMAVVGSRRRTGDIIIGGKNFAEQTIVGEMAALLIEHDTDLVVERKFNLASNLPMPMLERKDIDLFLDYTGTGYMDILGNTYQGESSQEIYKAVCNAYPEKFQAEWLSPIGFSNTYTLTMRAEHAKELGIETISDLADHTYLKAGFDAAFIDRGDGYPGIIKHYGFEFDQAPSQLSIGLMYTACKEDEVDVINAFSTDGRIAAFNLKILEDDKNFFPPYDAAFVVRKDTLQAHPEIRDILEKLAGILDDTAMQKLNFKVDEEDEQATEVARQFLVEAGLIEAAQ